MICANGIPGKGERTMEKKDRDFLLDADNVYRTKKYIVKQRIDFEVSDVYDNMLISHDTFYLRTANRDRIYEQAYNGKHNLEGVRIRTDAGVRKYIV